MLAVLRATSTAVINRRGMRMKKKLYTAPSCQVCVAVPAKIMAVSLNLQVSDESPNPGNDPGNIDDDASQENHWGSQW